LGGAGRRGRRVVVPEVDVDRLRRRCDRRGERGIGRLSPAEVAEGRRVHEVADADRARVGESRLDPVPRRMLEVEREPERRVERAEQELDRSVVARALHRDPHRPEPVAERPQALPEDVQAAEPAAGQLRRELEPVRHLLRPAAELLLRGEAVAGRVQLDGREPRRVVREELGRVHALRVEVGPPRGIRPAGGADARGHVPSGTTTTVRGPLATMETVTHGARTPPAPTFPVETFTDAERARLEPHFTNLDLPVFGLVNLPETVKGALFARYSRYPGTLRRLFLDEFADSVPEVPSIEGSEGERAAALYDRIFVGYGDDSVAQLGGAHIACEWTSNLLTKILQRPRLASYLEQSTRYIAYDTQIDGFGYRYHRDPRFGAEYERALDGLFATYTRLLEGTEAWVAGQFPRGADESAAAHARAVRAKALDLVRGILPAASLSHMGIYASGQTYEQLVLHLLAHPLAEAQTYGELLLQELRKIIPSFVARVPRPDRGGRWIEYLRERRHAAEAGAERLGLVGAEDGGAGTGVPSVTLLRAHGTEEELAAALLFES